MERQSELKSARLLEIYSRLSQGAVLKKSELAQDFHVTPRRSGGPWAVFCVFPITCSFWCFCFVCTWFFGGHGNSFVIAFRVYLGHNQERRVAPCQR